MEEFGRIVVFLIGLAIFLISASDIADRFQWGVLTEKDPLVIYIPVFSIGCYLIYVSLVGYFF